jgi:hypothetical protein
MGAVRETSAHRISRLHISGIGYPVYGLWKAVKRVSRAEAINLAPEL